MEKEKTPYIAPEVELIVFSDADIITTSPDPDEGEWDLKWIRNGF